MPHLKQQRPLSPHLGIYKPQITSVMSITHRATGVFLSLGMFVLVAWLWSVAYDQAYFDWWNAMFATIPGMLALAAWTFAFYYHLGNGIRHMFWDMGKGFDLCNVTISGLLVILFALAMTGVSWFIIFEGMIGGLL